MTNRNQSITVRPYIVVLATAVLILNLGADFAGTTTSTETVNSDNIATVLNNHNHNEGFCLNNFCQKSIKADFELWENVQSVSGECTQTVRQINVISRKHANHGITPYQERIKLDKEPN